MIDRRVNMEQISDHLCRYKNYNFATGLTTAEYLDSLQEFEIRESDVFLITYPKSGQWNSLTLAFFQFFSEFSGSTATLL